MSLIKKPTALASLTATYTDSEGEPESDDELSPEGSNYIVPVVPPPVKEFIPIIPAPELVDTIARKQISKLISYSEGGIDDDAENKEDSDFEEKGNSDDSMEDEEKTNDVDTWQYSPTSFHKSLLNLKPEEVQLPPAPRGRCSNSLQEKIAELYEKKLKEGKDMNATIQKKKNFRNPSIYEKLINYCGIDELGTNYPPEIFNQHNWGPESFYDQLAKRQKEEMEKREKEKKERTKVEFISGTVKKTSEVPKDNKRKSKWDIGSSQVTVLPTSLKPATLVNPASVMPVTTATGTKPTVISAFGTIAKKVKR